MDVLPKIRRTRPFHASRQGSHLNSVCGQGRAERLQQCCTLSLSSQPTVCAGGDEKVLHPVAQQLRDGQTHAIDHCEAC